MALASLNETDNVYRLLVLLHVLAVIVGFGSTFVYPILGNYGKNHPGLEGKGVSNASQVAGHKLTEPAIYAAGAFGVILVFVGPFEWEDPWVGLSLLLYLAALFFSLFVHQPNLRRMDALINELAAMGPPPGAGGPPPGDGGGPPPGAGGPPPQVVELEQRGKAAARNGGILHLAFAVILILMIFGARGAWIA